jgi:hypothetical protein
MPGVAQATTPVSSYIGADANGYGLLPQNGYGYHATATTYAGGPGATVIGIYFDSDNGTLGFIANGVDLGIIYTGLTGDFCPALSLYAAAGVANFGASAFTHAPPTGYVAWNA